MLTRRGLFGVVVGAVAAAFGVKPKAPTVLVDRETGIAVRLIQSWQPGDGSLFNPRGDIARLYREGRISQSNGIDWYAHTHEVFRGVPSHDHTVMRAL